MNVKPCKFAVEGESGWECTVYRKTYCVHQVTTYDENCEVVRVGCGLTIEEIEALKKMARGEK